MRKKDGLFNSVRLRYIDRKGNVGGGLVDGLKHTTTLADLGPTGPKGKKRKKVRKGSKK